METRMPTQEELPMAVATTSTPNPDHTYSTTVRLPMPIPIFTTASSLVPSPVPIYSTVTTTFAIPPTLLPICDSITDMLRYALGQGPHPTLLPQQTTLVQSTMSAQAPITSPIVASTHPFNVHLDPADMDFLKKKAKQCHPRQKNALLSEGQANPYITTVAAVEDALC